jgi:hypothetical protein
MMIERLDDYDWAEVFKYAGDPKNVRFCEKVPTGSFTREDVSKIIAIYDGENDWEDWLGLFSLKDGRFAFVGAWCDYTGWG